MRSLANIAAGFKSLFQKTRLEHELDEELESFLAASVENKLKGGLPAKAARQAALVEMGSRNAVKHQVWSSRWESTLESILADLRISFRTLLKSPGYTAVALISLAFGIGANTAIFTLINQVLLHKLPVRDPQQLVAFGDSESAGIAGGIDLGQFGGYFSWDFARQLEADPGPFQGIAAYGSFSDKVTLRPTANRGGDANAPAFLAPANLVSGNYFSVLGAEPLLGRTIFPSDNATPGTGAVVVLSYHLWRESLSSDPHIVGKSISLNGTPFEVIGVMREGFHGIKQELEPADLWAPISMQATVLQFPSMLTPHSGLYFLHLFGRLSPNAVANKAEFLRSQSWLNENVHNGIRDRSGSALSIERQQEINRELVPLIPAARGVSMIRSEYGESLQILMAVVALVLLIACANLANFLLARAARRRHETNTRLALGSSRTRIVRQSLVEAFLLSMMGALLGLGVAFVATRALIAFVSQGDPYIAMRSSPDLKVLAFTLAISLLTGFLFGLVPAITAARIGARGPLTSTTRSVQSGSGRLANFWPKSLVSVQVMISLLLLVVAGLFLRSLRNLENQDYGFERNHLLLAQTNARLGGYAPHQVAALHQQLLERLAAIPGVRSVALAQMPPISEGSWTSSISLSGYTPDPKENMVSVLNRVTGRYFETAGISIVAGRAISDADTANSLKVAVVNQTLAQH
jgi:predicted permease